MEPTNTSTGTRQRLSIARNGDMRLERCKVRPYDLRVLGIPFLKGVLLVRRPDLQKEIEAELNRRCDAAYGEYGV